MTDQSSHTTASRFGSIVGVEQYKSYPTYKDSGIEWLGEIPAHWEVKRTKHVAQLESGHTPSRQNPEYWQDCEIPWFTLADVWQIRDKNKSHVTKTQEKVSETGLAHSSARLLPKGTVILSRTASVGFSTIMGVDMATTQDFVNWVCRPHLRPEYLLYVFRSMDQEFQRLTMGSTHQTIYMPDVGQFVSPLPPILEQDQIVEFIQAETTKIDAVVAKKERLLELLQEKRYTLITHAMTKGLDPNVPMENSDIEWVGKIPAHWSSKRLKTIARIRYGLGQPPRESLEGLPFIRATNVVRGRITEKDMVYIDPADVPMGRDALLAELEIIVVRSGAYTGDSAIIPRVYDGAVAGYDMVVTVNHAIAEFVAIALLCTYIRDCQLVVSSMRSAQPHLNAEELGAALLVLPPLIEQRAIVAFLDPEIAKIDALVKKIRSAIKHRKELRTALVSAVVTGKIDVRKLPPESFGG